MVTAPWVDRCINHISTEEKTDINVWQTSHDFPPNIHGSDLYMIFIWFPGGCSSQANAIGSSGSSLASTSKASPVASTSKASPPAVPSTSSNSDQAAASGLGSSRGFAGNQQSVSSIKSLVVEDEVDRILAKENGRIPRKTNSQLLVFPCACLVAYQLWVFQISLFQVACFQ